MSTLGELYAPKYLGRGYTRADQAAMQTKIASTLGANSLRYLPVQALPECIGLPADHLCTGCVTTDYPSPAGERIYENEIRRTNDGLTGRGYDTDVLTSCATADDA